MMNQDSDDIRDAFVAAIPTASGGFNNKVYEGRAVDRQLIKFKGRVMTFLEALDGSITVDEIREALSDFELEGS